MLSINTSLNKNSQIGKQDNTPIRFKAKLALETETDYVEATGSRYEAILDGKAGIESPALINSIQNYINSGNDIHHSVLSESGDGNLVSDCIELHAPSSLKIAIEKGMIDPRKKITIDPDVGPETPREIADSFFTTAIKNKQPENARSMLEVKKVLEAGEASFNTMEKFTNILLAYKPKTSRAELLRNGLKNLKAKNASEKARKELLAEEAERVARIQIPKQLEPKSAPALTEEPIESDSEHSEPDNKEFKDAWTRSVEERLKPKSITEPSPVNTTSSLPKLPKRKTGKKPLTLEELKQNQIEKWKNEKKGKIFSAVKPTHYSAPKVPAPILAEIQRSSQQPIPPVIAQPDPIPVPNPVASRVKNWQMPNNWENWSIKDLGRKKQSRGRSRSIPTKRDFNRASSLPPNPFNTPQPEQRKAELEAYIETRRPLVHRAEKLAKKYSALWRTPDFSTSEKRAEYMKNKLDPSKKKNFLALTKSEQSKGSRLPKAFGIAHRIVNR